MDHQKHAYLIMVHEKPEIFKILLQMIDDVRNDIYVHIDSKSDSQPFVDSFRLVKKSRILFIDNRVDVRWAHVSQVQAEFNLFKAAYDNGGYLYYHLLSGVDLPIKSQEYIHDFFEINKGAEFIGFSQRVPVDYYLRIHIFPKYLRNKGCIQSKFRYYFLLLQKIIGFRLKSNYNLRKGPNWVSITNEMVEKIICDTPKMIKQFKYSRSFDECYKQTIAFSYPEIYHKVYDPIDELHGSMRLIDWQRGYPYSYTFEDLSEIKKSDRLFCRKINDVRLANYLLYFINSKRCQIEEPT